MKIGLAGLPMSGKTTLFNLVTRNNAQLKDYIAQSEEVNTGVIKVPDARVDKLAEFFKPKKTTYATVEFIDIPGIAKEEGPKTGFSVKTLAHIRSGDAIALVVRLFVDESVAHVHRRIDPASDLEELLLEFIFADLELVENKIVRLGKELKAGKKPELVREQALMDQLAAALKNNQTIASLALDAESTALIRGFRFLTEKPLLVVGNCNDAQLAKPDGDPMVASMRKIAAQHGWPTLLVAGKTEMECAGLSPEEERTFLAEYGITTPGRDKLITEAYNTLRYISFLTAGEDECRAWPLQRGTNAQKAAGKIHSDIERGFIRAETVAFADFVQHGGLNGAKQAGVMRLEGKEYIVQDGDIINFRFNV